LGNFKVLITLDYELPAHKAFDVSKFMIKPTNRLIEICQSNGAKLTIMLEIAELWAFEKSENFEFIKLLGYDPARKIRNQLEYAIKLGHDVQLHLHPQWIDAKWMKNSWKLNYDKYRLPEIRYQELVKILQRGKRDLEKSLSPCCHDYSCVAFRSGNWNTQPSNKYIRALKEAGIKCDTSVFKWGYINNLTANLDYRSAHSNIMPWFTSAEDINIPTLETGVIEVPIYTERTNLLGMFNLKRLGKARKYIFENMHIEKQVRESIKEPVIRKKNSWAKIDRFIRKYPKKLDFCKLTSNEMMQMVESAVRKYSTEELNFSIPIVMIGHTKEIDRYKSLSKFLDKCNRKFHGLIQFANMRDAVKEYFNMAGEINRHVSYQKKENNSFSA
jgi:hypothetical protein